MSNNMDLRSPEYIAAQRFLKPPLLAFIIVLAFTILIIAGLQAATCYKYRLERAIRSAEESAAILQVTSEPLILMKEDLETIIAKKTLLDEVITDSKPLASQLKTISDRSTASGVDLQRISITESGDLAIEGYVSQAKDAATFNQQLSTISFIDSCQVNRIDLSGNENYLFIINGRLKQGESCYED